jgi:hypothetical protein
MITRFQFRGFIESFGFSWLLIQAVATMAVSGPFSQVVLIPYYSPHAYKVAEWSIAYLLRFPKQFGSSALGVFAFVYGASELWFNGFHLLTNSASGLFDWLYPAKMLLFATAFIGGWLVAKPKIVWGGTLWKYVLLIFYLSGYLLGFILNFPASNILSDFIGNTSLIVLALWFLSK